MEKEGIMKDVFVIFFLVVRYSSVSFFNADDDFGKILSNSKKLAPWYQQN